MSNKMIELGDTRRASVDSLAELLREAGCTVELPEEPKKLYPKKRFDGGCNDNMPCYLIVEADVNGVTLSPISHGPGCGSWRRDIRCLSKALQDAIAYHDEAEAAEGA